MSPLVKRTLVIGALFAGVAGIGGLKWRNAGLRDEVGEWRRRNATLASVREENRRLRELADETEPTVAAVVPALAEPSSAPVTKTEGRRLPLGAFRNLGRGTPEAAFETILWAVVKGDDATMIGTLSLTGEARAKAEAILARRPEATRTQYGTPEKLVGLFFSAGILVGADSFQIVGEERTDPTHATLHVQADGKADTFPMVLGADGWQLVVPERALTVIDRILRYPPAGTEPAK